MVFFIKHVSFQTSFWKGIKAVLRQGYIFCYLMVVNNWGWNGRVGCKYLHTNTVRRYWITMNDVPIRKYIANSSNYAIIEI